MSIANSARPPPRPSSPSRDSSRTAVSRSNAVSAMSASATNQALVGDPVRAVGGRAEQGMAMLLVGLEVALEPCDVRVALEREHVRGDAVQEPAVVGDDHRAAGKFEQRVL